MSIFDMFKAAAPAAPVASTPNTPGSIPANTPNTGAASDTAAPNGVLPQDDPNKSKEETPLAQFDKLWQPDATDPNAPKKPEGVFGDVDPKKFMEAAGKIDFAKAVTPEEMQAIAAGGESAQKAMAAMLNKVAQGAYAQSAFASTKMIEAALAKAKDGFVAELPQHIRRESLSSTLREENPVFANPAVQPIISAMEEQFTRKYPNATTAEITTMAKQYISELGTAFTGQKKIGGDTSAQNAVSQQDWEEWISKGIQ